MDSVSIGYRYDLSNATIIDDDVPLVILRNVEVFELSSVWRGFDQKAKLGRSLKDGKIMEEELPTRVDDSLLPSVSEEEGGLSGGIDPDAVALRIKLMRRNLKLKIKTGDML